MVGYSSAADASSERVSDFAISDMFDTKSRGKRVLIVDSNLLTAESVAAALAQHQFNARFVLPVTTEHLRSLSAWQPQVALVDIDSVTMDAAVACIRTLGDAGIPTAVLTCSLDTPVAGESVHAGAISIVDKGAPLSQLVDVLLRILDGNEAMSEPTKRRLLERRGRLAAFEILTQREKFVLSQLMEGFSAEAIARGSGVSISTIRSQIKAILQKLGVNSQLAAASMARQVGWTFSALQGHLQPSIESEFHGSW
jgi:two-component system, NarL family, nitrate/nitrite response regulator NarL